MPFDSKTAAVAGRNSTRKGVTNQRSMELKEKFIEFINQDKGEIFEIIRNMDDEKRVQWTYKFAQLVMPRTAETNVQQNFENVKIDMSEWK